MTLFSSRIKHSGVFHFLGSVWLLCLGSYTSHAQATDQDQILTLRNASNATLKAFDHEGFLSYLTDDVHVTTGNGTLVQGKATLRNYIASAIGQKVFFVRTASEVVVNTERGLAWETGTWQGFAADQPDTPLTGGKYSAMWTKASGIWLIKSELFVTLE